MKRKQDFDGAETMGTSSPEKKLKISGFIDFTLDREKYCPDVKFVSLIDGGGTSLPYM